MSDKTKNIIKNIIIAVLAVWLLIVTVFLIDEIKFTSTIANDMTVSDNFFEMNARITALEMGTTWDELVAEHEANNPPASTGEAVQEQ